MVEALYNIASCASFDTFAYNSRISRTVAYTTVLRALRGLAEQEAEVVKGVGRESGKCGLLVIDNVQHYHTRRQPRIGLSNQMNVGLAGRKKLAEGQRESSSAFNGSTHSSGTSHSLLISNLTSPNSIAPALQSYSYVGRQRPSRARETEQI